MSPVVKKSDFRVCLRLRYGADLGRSRLIKYIDELVIAVEEKTK